MDESAHLNVVIDSPLVTEKLDVVMVYMLGAQSIASVTVQHLIFDPMYIDRHSSLYNSLCVDNCHFYHVAVVTLRYHMHFVIVCTSCIIFVFR